MRKLFSLLLIFLIGMLLVSCQPNTSDVSETSTEELFLESVGEVRPLLYLAQDEDGDRVWLFGSVHIGFEGLYPLPSYVTDAFDKADALAVEVDISDPQALTGVMGTMMHYTQYTDGTTISDHIDPALYEQACTILEDNLIETEPLESFKPFMWYSLVDQLTMEQSIFDSSFGVDQHLLDLAQTKGKPVEEIETAEFQLELQLGMEDELQEMMLQSAVAQYSSGNADAAYNLIVAVWAKGDESLFEDYLSFGDMSVNDPSYTEEQRNMYEDYNRAMIDDRNVTMTDYAEQALKDGKELFICVGAAHVVGEDAMVDLLRERGYTVELVS